MPDGLFHQRPTNPAPVDLDRVVRDVVEFEDPTTGERNVTVPVRWDIVSLDQPWPLLVVYGDCWTADGHRETWRVHARIPRLRALEHEVKARVEEVLLAVAQHVEERRRAGYTFHAPDAPAVPAAPAPKRDKRRRIRA